MSSHPIPRYDRQFEPVQNLPVLPAIYVPDLEAALQQSTLSDGTRELVRALIRLARPSLFPGGGVGLEYGGLLKTATRPDLLSKHISEAARYLVERDVDLLVVPGMSGYPIGAMYSMASGIPAILLKKQSWDPSAGHEHPPGSFIIPSYTGNVDTVISADISGARDILSSVVKRQIATRANDQAIHISIRIAGADEIIDKATMATAITENAPVFVRSVVDTILAQLSQLIAGRPVTISCEVVAWATPLLKGYGGTESVLTTRFGIEPFAGVTLSAIQLDPPAIGIEGIGMIRLEVDE